MSILNRIEESYESMKHICDTANSPCEYPNTLIMNSVMFTEWYYYCTEQGVDYMEWNDVKVMLDKNSPFKIAWTWTLEF